MANKFVWQINDPDGLLAERIAAQAKASGILYKRIGKSIGLGIATHIYADVINAPLQPTLTLRLPGKKGSFIKGHFGFPIELSIPLLVILLVILIWFAAGTSFDVYVNAALIFIGVILMFKGLNALVVRASPERKLALLSFCDATIVSLGGCRSQELQSQLQIEAVRAFSKSARRKMD